MPKCVTDATQKREALGGEKHARLASYVLGLAKYNMRQSLAKAGLEYTD